MVQLLKTEITEDTGSLILKLNGSETVKNKISSVYQKKISAKEKHAKVAKLIASHLSDHGIFVEDAGTGIFCLNSGQIYQITKKDRTFSSFIFENYGICNATPGFKILIANLDNKCLKNKEIKIKKQFYFSGDDDCFFIPTTNNQLLRCSKEGIEKIPNGSGGILIKSSDEFVPFSYTKNPKMNNISLQDIIADGLSCPKVSSFFLNINEAVFLLEIIIYFILFSQTMPTRPIIEVRGEHGTGKSSLLKSIGLFMFGKNFDLSLIPRERRELEVEFANNTFCCFDNVDRSLNQSLKDALAAVATGCGIRTRQLFTTDKQKRYSPSPVIGMTTRTTPFSANDDDLINRLIIFQLTKRVNFKPENQIKHKLLQARDSIMSSVINKIPSVIKGLKTNTPIDVGPFRMADFAEFAGKVAIPIFMDRYSKDEIEKRLKQAFKKLQASQQAVLSETPLHYALDDYVNSWFNIYLTSLTISTSKLFNALKTNDKNTAYGFAKSCNTLISFGKLMKNKASLFEKRYGYSSKRGTGNKLVHTFIHKCQDPLEI